jgi:putrescine transport system ATP-binding protein
MFEGRIIEDEPDHVRIESEELGGTFYIDHGVSAAPTSTVWVAVRPEKISLSREAPPGSDNVARGVVKEIAYMGDLSIYLVKLAAGRMVRVTQPNTVRHAEGRITWEEEVYLHWHSTSPVVVTQ